MVIVKFAVWLIAPVPLVEAETVTMLLSGGETRPVALPLLPVPPPTVLVPPP